jgi:hypothetical protein
LLAIFLFSQWQSTSKQKDRPKAILHSVIEIDQSAIAMLLRRRYVPKRMSATPMIIIAQAAADPFGPLGLHGRTRYQIAAIDPSAALLALCSASLAGGSPMRLPIYSRAGCLSLVPLKLTPAPMRILRK